MTLLQPKTIANDLFARLEAFTAANSVPTAFELKRLERDAEALGKVAPEEGSIAKAGLAALRWDAEQALYYVKNACLLDSSEATLLNAALTCRLLNLFQEAAHYSLIAAKKSPTSHRAASDSLEYVLGTGDVQLAVEVAERHERLGLELGEHASVARELSKFMAQANVSQARLQFELGLAVDTMIDHQVRCLGFRWISGNDPDGRKTFAIGLCFAGDLDDEFEMEAELAEKLSASPEWDPNVLSIELHSQDADVLQPA